LLNLAQVPGVTGTARRRSAIAGRRHQADAWTGDVRCDQVAYESPESALPLTAAADPIDLHIRSLQRTSDGESSAPMRERVEPSRTVQWLQGKRAHLKELRLTLAKHAIYAIPA